MIWPRVNQIDKAKWFGLELVLKTSNFYFFSNQNLLIVKPDSSQDVQWLFCVIIYLPIQLDL